jgi:hypothetical protein
MTPDSCFLCGEPAHSTPIDQGSRTYFECSSPECGDYEISWSAMERLSRNERFKLRAKQEANSCRGEGAYFEITVSGASEITGTRIKKTRRT